MVTIGNWCSSMYRGGVMILFYTHISSTSLIFSAPSGGRRTNSFLGLGLVRLSRWVGRAELDEVVPREQVNHTISNSSHTKGTGIAAGHYTCTSIILLINNHAYQCGATCIKVTRAKQHLRYSLYIILSSAPWSVKR